MMIRLPLYISTAILHTFFINLTHTLSAAVDNVPPQHHKKQLNNSMRSIIWLMVKKSEGIWAIRVFLLFEDSLITEYITLWNASEDCCPLYLPNDDRRLVQMAESGGGCLKSGQFIFWLSIQPRNNRVFHHEHCYVTEERQGFQIKTDAHDASSRWVFFFSTSLYMMANVNGKCCVL